MQETFFGLSALIALIPVTLAAVLRPKAGRDGTFWLLLAVAVAGPAAWSVVQTAEAWRTGLSTTLWVTVASSMALFAIIAAVSRHAWRLTPLLGAYMTALAIFALVWGRVQAPALTGEALSGWVALHIAVSVATYGLVTVGAVAALAAFLQERALKTKRPTALTHLLPSVVDCERLTVRLLAVGEGVLALGLVTGMALQYGGSGTLLTPDHKTILTFGAFGVIGALLLAHFLSGVRGRAAARLVLVAYLLLTLGYPGVKFVTDVLLA